jgi:nitrite reductase (NADH) large subunit
VVAVSSGWELHVGGNGGAKLRATDLLCKVGTEDEVLETCGAFIQFYREHAHYLERTASWIERIGLAAVKKRIVDDVAGRGLLFERFLLAQRFAQEDPWRKESGCAPDRSEFQPLMEVVNT